jgi:hypothetical protein
MPSNSREQYLDYLDFDLRIGTGRGREYPVTVLRSPAGEARETMVFPYDTLALDSCLKDLQTQSLCAEVSWL